MKSALVGQTSLDPKWRKRWLPAYERYALDPSWLFDPLGKEERRQLIHDLSAIEHVTSDDPPIYMSYRMAPDDPVPSDGVAGWVAHHVMFGVRLKEKMDALGVEADLSYPGATSRYDSMPEFFKTELLGLH